MLKMAMHIGHSQEIILVCVMDSLWWTVRSAGAFGHLGTEIPKLLKINDFFFLKLIYFNTNSFQINDLILAHYGKNEVRTVKIFWGFTPETPEKSVFQDFYEVSLVTYKT